MKLNKRNFLQLGSTAVGTLALSGSLSAAKTQASQSSGKGQLHSIIGNVEPINVKERRARLDKAQEIMRRQNMAAIVVEPGATMEYFCGIQWWRSERLTALVIPREGDIAVVCPSFEEPSIRESLAIGDDVRVWQEHDSPFMQVRHILVDRGLGKGKLGFEHSVRYFVQRGVMARLPAMQDVSANSVTWGCRMYKSPQELSLMHKANEITLNAYTWVWRQLDVGMTSEEIIALMQQAQSALGGQGIWNMALCNEASAYPHGTQQRQTLREGSVVLMDCGCEVHGYQSDVSRTFVLGEPEKRHKTVWQTVRKGQQIAFEAAQIGVAAGVVDDEVRRYYESLGYGPGYQTPGLSHRTGHGIGMEGHESVNFVHKEQTLLKPGMCFSNEPGLYLYGEFGVRLEDCLYMTESGPRWFTHPPDSLDSPIGKMGMM
ncbi:MAG: aminopeptidase P family protein [Halieaceae bacterium]|jgi:Xaa-Pro dipeptidase|nr:aminopeptidase P family protein [Halieaceae bacterium]